MNNAYHLKQSGFYVGLLSAMVSLMIVLVCRDAMPPALAAGTESAGQPASPAIDCSAQDVTNVPTADCNALVALYNATNGIGWTYQSRWLQAHPTTSEVGSPRNGLFRV